MRRCRAGARMGATSDFVGFFCAADIGSRITAASGWALEKR